MADKQKVFVSGPGAVRGKAPVVTKTVPVKSSTSKSKVSNANIEAAKALGNVSKDIGKLGGLLATYLGGGATETAVTPVTPAPTTSTTDDALLQAILAGQQTAAAQAAAQAQAERQSAYDILLAEFTRYGLSALVEPLKGFIISGASPAELTIQLQNTDAYKDTMGTQAGFQTLLANDVSATELEDRVLTAQNRVKNANPEVAQALKAFYPDITNGDILAYTLDPSKGLDAIKRKVTAAEIGGAAIAQGLTAGVTRAEELAGYGVTKEQAQQGYETIAEIAPRGGQLADFYKESPYTQQTAEQEVFNLAGSAAAAQKRKKLTALETAAFSGQAGVGALARERAGNF